MFKGNIIVLRVHRVSFADRQDATKRVEYAEVDYTSGEVTTAPGYEGLDLGLGVRVPYEVAQRVKLLPGAYEATFTTTLIQDKYGNERQAIAISNLVFKGGVELVPAGSAAPVNGVSTPAVSGSR